MSQLKRTDFSTIYSCGLNLLHPCPQRVKGDFFKTAQVIYRMRKLIKPQAAVHGTLCRRVRVKECSGTEEVAVLVAEGGSYSSQNNMGLKTEPLDSTPSLHRFIEISHTPGPELLNCSGQAEFQCSKLFLA